MYGFARGHGLTIPSWGRTAQAAELQAFDPVTRQWVVVFRQTLPYLFKSGQWSVNADDPGNETYGLWSCTYPFRKFYTETDN